MKSTLSSFVLAALFTASSALAVAVPASTATANLNVTATVINNCLISTTAVAFGVYDPISAQASTALTGTGALTVTCTKGAAATITLGQGSYAASGSSDGTPRRQMKSASTFQGAPVYLGYTLYSDNAHTALWGNTASTGAAYNGTGISSSVNVYGSISAAQNVPAGSYSDTVVVTITF
jgi:spore coat protein U-like protein